MLVGQYECAMRLIMLLFIISYVFGMRGKIGYLESYVFKIETERLIIRDMQFEDEPDFVTISQDKKYQRFYDESDCNPEKYRELTRLFVQQAQDAPRTAYQLAVELKQTGEFIGIVCLRLEPEHQASMGCGLSRHHQGQSLMEEATTALASFGFKELSIHRIYTETISDNKAAIKLCERLGMHREALLKENRYFKGRWWSTVILAILHSEWEHKGS
jgi:RimJ/RimL family protein N-acetyltransferase